MEVEKNFWIGKRVLVTGGMGFVASHLVAKLLSLGAFVVVIVRENRSAQSENILNNNGGISLAEPITENCDIMDFDRLREICGQHQIDTIFHLAASTIVSEAANSPVKTTENNVMGTLNILEVARINKIQRVLISSSDKSYGDHADDTLEILPYREDYALRGLDVYSASKVCTDMLTQTYSYQFKVPALVVRACNIFGPGDLNFTRLIPKTIMCLLAGKPPQINQGNENVLREYIYIDDVVTAYLYLMEKIALYYGDNNRNMPRVGKATYGWAAFNVGSYDSQDLASLENCKKIRSVNHVIRRLREKIKDIEPIIKEKPANFIEIPNQYMDSSKLINFGFKTTIDFDRGLEKTIAWYKQNFDYLDQKISKRLTQ